MSGSSSSSSTRCSPGSPARARAQRLARGRRGEHGHGGLLRAAQLAGTRQLDVQALGADVRERLGAQGRVQDVGRDLGVEGHPRQRAAAPAQAASRRVGSRRDSSHTSSGLTSWPDSGLPAAMTAVGQAPARPPSAATTTRPSVPRTARPEQRAPPRSHVVERRADGQLGLRREPRRRGRRRAPRLDTMPGSREHGRQQLRAGRSTRCRGRGVRGRRRGSRGRPARASAPPPTRIEVEAQLEPAPSPGGGRAAGAPAGDLGGGHRAQSVRLAQHVPGRRGPPRRPSPAAAPRASGTRTPGTAG